MVVCSPLLAEYFNDYIRALARAQYQTRPASLTPPAAQANRPEGVQLGAVTRFDGVTRLCI